MNIIIYIFFAIFRITFIISIIPYIQHNIFVFIKGERNAGRCAADAGAQLAGSAARIYDSRRCAAIFRIRATIYGAPSHLNIYSHVPKVIYINNYSIHFFSKRYLHFIDKINFILGNSQLFFA